MNNSNKILNSLLSEDLASAKKQVNESLMLKLGSALEEKLVNFAPSVFNEAKLSKKEFAAQAEPKDKATFADKLALIKKKNISEGWTEEIPNAEMLAKYLAQYQMTGKMSRELAAYFAANPSMGVSTREPQITSQPQTPQFNPTAATTINAGYEPEMDQIIENFEAELFDIVEEIEQELGEKLSENEIAEIAEQYLSILEEQSIDSEE